MSSRFFKRIAAPGLLGLALLAVVLLAAIGGGGSDASANNGVDGLDRAIAAQEAHTASLFGIQGVVGTGVGLDDDGNAVVVVFTDVPGVGGIPSQVDGVSTSVRVSGPFVALPRGGNGGGPGGGKDKNKAPTVTITAPTDGDNFLAVPSDVSFSGTASDPEDLDLTLSIVWKLDGEQIDTGSGGSTGDLIEGTYVIEASVIDSGGKSDTASVTITVGPRPDPPFDRTAKHRPAPIGVSTGHPDITAGTLGARLKDDNGKLYALSNNHIYGASNDANIGDAVLQPGAFDGGTVGNDTIGTLATYAQLAFDGSANRVDAAIALVTSVAVGNSTPDGEGYGTPSSTTAIASLNQPVQKYGRTTGWTTGTVTEVNLALQVCYGQVKGRVCFGGLANFTGQIAISDGSFSAGGDSGSLIVTQAGNNPVGLLFAGSSTRTIANHIGDVLSELSNQDGVGTLTIDGSGS